MSKKRRSVTSLVEELRLFHHYEAADMLEKLYMDIHGGNRSEGDKGLLRELAFSQEVGRYQRGTADLLANKLKALQDD